jgi:hypothetical protein
MLLIIGAPATLTHMVDRIKNRLASAYRPTTRRNQDAAIKAYIMCCIFFEIEVKSINSFNLLAFIKFLIESQLSVPTIKNYISSLKSRFKPLGV